jgi:hypothetical protein
MLYYPGITPISAILFESPNIVDNINRSYMKIQDLFAKIGGLINALVILMKVLSSNYIDFIYFNKLIKLSNEEQANRIEIKSIKDQDSIEKMNPQNKLKVNNYTYKDKQDQNDKDSHKKIHTNILKISKIDSSEQTSKNTKTGYFNYMFYLLLCKGDSLEIMKQIKLMKKKIDIRTKIKIINFVYYNLHEKAAD